MNIMNRRHVSRRSIKHLTSLAHLKHHLGVFLYHLEVDSHDIIHSHGSIRRCEFGHALAEICIVEHSDDII